MTDLLQQGIAAARAGRRSEARAMLMRVVEADERSELGWLWLSGVVDDPEDIRTCLHNVLDINPSNPNAKQGLAWIEQRHGPSTRSQAQPAQAPASAAPDAVTAPQALVRPAGRNLERTIGNSYTQTTTNLQPVGPPSEPTTAPAPAPAPPQHTPPVASLETQSQAPRRPPPTPTNERFKLPKPAPLPERPPARQPRPQARPPARPDPDPTAVYAPIGAAPAAVVPPLPATPTENPCPYCGAPTTLTQRRCTQCRGDLMVRAAPPEKRSFALSLLGILWGIGGVLTLLLAALMAGLFVLSRRTASAGASASDQILTSFAVALLFGLLYISVSRGLLARRRWAYYVNILLIVLSLIGTLAAVAAGAVLLSLLGAAVSRAGGARAAGTLGLLLPLLVGGAFVLLPIVLTALSYRDFTGPLVRFVRPIEDRDHMGHYNSGVAYKNRGMWYAAAQEWEAAIKKKPRDASYLHALGLAYTRLKRLDQARATLDAAINAAPEDPKIKESRALVDQVAAK